jgi:two-component system sensor histidine kinase/response regulator
VLANAMRLDQVIISFISNAVKYAPNSKHIQVITRITPDRELYFGVRDFGIGIQEENLEQVFGKFFRVSDDASQAQGLGIGLYICAEILKRHNARLGVSSDYGNGSLFYFTMPLLDHE